MLSSAYLIKLYFFFISVLFFFLIFFEQSINESNYNDQVQRKEREGGEEKNLLHL
jgi:hypothetical protein